MASLPVSGTAVFGFVDLSADPPRCARRGVQQLAGPPVGTPRARARARARYREQVRAPGFPSVGRSRVARGALHVSAQIEEDLQCGGRAAPQ
jgi:hypothetical protein